MNRSYVEMHLAILLAGFSGLFGKLITLNETLLVFYRVLFSSFILILIVLSIWKKNKMDLSFSKANFLLLANGALLALHWVFFFGSIQASSVSLGVLCLSLASFFTALLDPIINKTRLSLNNLALSALSLVGISLIFGIDSQYREGIILGIISSILVSLFTLFNERLVKKHDTMKVTMLQMSGGTIGLGIIILFLASFTEFQFTLPDSTNLFYLIILALVFTIFMYTLLNRSLRTINSFTVNLNFNLEPIYGIILAFLFFNESEDFNLASWMGVTLIIFSLGLQYIFSRPRKVVKVL
ncbi:DMT family transporter [Brumimicrobium oceani]|uniref:EamA family transporter n=1 Tax=Brumimicrobium oceani TaxID=2100725 RepID=A0A2U2XHD4_9FLAO|nr:DMT family transporter [Brumimicrobium oceani]PWH87206.1 EamA family transporter [Brumimicrobium oceani]